MSAVRGQTLSGSIHSKRIGHTINTVKTGRSRRELECPKSVTWLGDWEPDNKYVKPIVLKNTTLRLLKVSFTSPLTRTFSTPHPSNIIELAPGATRELAITFRPAEPIPYQDQITLTTNDGDYVVALRAKIATPKFRLPESVHFEPCAIGDVKSATFAVANISSLATRYQWQTHPEQGFTIEPLEGILHAQAQADFVIKFKPNKIASYRGIAQCRYGPDLEYTRRVSLFAESHFPQICLDKGNRSRLDFGIVAASAAKTKMIKLYNRTSVRARFMIVRQEPQIDQELHEFTCQVETSQLEIAPNSSLELPITYKPYLVDNVPSRQTFHIVDEFQPKIRHVTINCVGSSPIPTVALTEDTIDFGMVDITGGRKPSVAHSLRIRNTGSVVARFQFTIDCDCSVWQVVPKQGELKPGAYMDVIVKFEPWSEAPYYRRLPLFVEGSGVPIMLTLSGCAYSAELKPVHLTQEQLSRRVTPRVERLDPDSRQVAFDEGHIVYVDNELRFADEQCDKNVTCEYENLFDEDIKSVPNISLSRSSLVFETCQGNGQVHAQPVQVTNHTSGEVIAKWAIPVNKPYFTVHPQQVTLAPGASYLFTVRFSLEGSMESLFGGELELNCFYNIMMDYTELKTELVTPGWSKTLQVTASTFAPKSEPFPVRVKTPSLVAAPPTPTGVPTYRAIMIDAASADLPSTYRTLNDAYQVYPQVGLINPADRFHLVLLRAVSQAAEDVSALNFHFNNDPRHDQSVHVRILGGRPRLSCPPECYLQPTMIGGSMKKTFMVTNTSNLLINYEWYNSNQANLNIEPKSGIINPLEEAAFEVEMCPDEQKKYLLKPKLNYWTHSQSQAEQLTVRCIGEGTVAQVTASSSLVDFGSVMVNREKQEKLTLVNRSNCSVMTRLRVIESQDSQVNEANNGNNTCKQLRIENCEREVLDCITLGPRCSQTVYLSVQCSVDGNYSWEIYHEIVDQPKRKEPKQSRYSEELMCHVTAEVCYPTLKMAHLSCSDIIPKQLLYELTQAKKLNALLNAPPPQCEQSETDELVIVNLNSSTQHSRPFQIRMEIVNPGNTAAHFKFLFPADFRIELEGWARHADLSHDQFEVLKIEEHKLFQIEPRSGILQRGERKVIKMSYQHKLIGAHALPVVMSISGGRQIPLRLMGMTLSEADKCLAFPSEHYELKPVHLGLLRPPTQHVSFYNGSSQKIHYEIDLDSVKALNAANWEWQILTVLNPKGVVEPNSCGEIQMSFLPLEARDYHVDLIIRINGGPDQMIRIRGRGVDPSRSESPLDEAFLETGATRVENSEQQYALSQDRVKLGPVPLGSPVRRIIFLENRSATNAALFQWKLYDEQFMSIRPQSGQIEPGGQQMIRIEYFVAANNEPAFHNIESCCEIISIDKVKHYLNNLANWEKEYKRQNEEFTIDDSLHQPKQVRLIESAGEMRSCSPYSKLPPLSPLKSAKQRQEPIWVKPRPPAPEQLQLTVSARSLTRAEFLEKFPSEFDQFYSNASDLGQKSTVKKNDESMVTECTDEEARTMKTILANVVRTLLDDSYMQDILKEQMNEQPCYFAQLEGAKWPPKKAEPTMSKNRLIASIMAMEESDCPPTPVNSSEDSHATSSQAAADPNQMSDLLLVEQVMSEMLENIVAQASSFETILTAKPLNIVQKK